MNTEGIAANIGLVVGLVVLVIALTKGRAKLPKKLDMSSAFQGLSVIILYKGLEGIIPTKNAWLLTIAIAWMIGSFWKKLDDLKGGK